jgi:hypothetical protein
VDTIVASPLLGPQKEGSRRYAKKGIADSPSDMRIPIVGVEPMS